MGIEDDGGLDECGVELASLFLNIFQQPDHGALLDLRPFFPQNPHCLVEPDGVDLGELDEGSMVLSCSFVGGVVGCPWHWFPRFSCVGPVQVREMAQDLGHKLMEAEYFLCCGCGSHQWGAQGAAHGGTHCGQLLMS